MSSSAYSQPLHKALLSCNVPTLHMLARAQSLDVHMLTKTMCLLSDNSRRGCHLTPLQAAVMTGSYLICKLLISEGANFFSLQYNVPHSLHIALDCNQFGIAQLLITSGANVNAQQHGFYPMYYAITPDSPEYIVQAIITAGFNPDAIIERIYHTTALHRAVICNNLPVVKVLMKYKVNCDQVDLNQGHTPLHIAVKQKNVEIVKLLVEYGADPEVECREGYTALFYAINNNDLQSVVLLLNHGASVAHLSSVKLIYPLNYAVSLCKEEITKVLLKFGADTKKVTQGTGNTALHRAAMSQQGKLSQENKVTLLRIVEVLIDNGVDLDVPNKYGYTPVQLAIKEENFNLVECLIREGAAVNTALDQGTNFHLVAKLASKETVTTFLEHGADYSVVDKNGVTPYHKSILNPNKNVLQSFWNFGCPFDLPLQENSRNPIYKSDTVNAMMVQEKFISGIISNDVNMMCNALKDGAVSRGCSRDFPYPLNFACANGFILTVQILLNLSVPVNVLDHNGQTPLHVSASRGYYHICLDLLRHGAVFNYPSKSSGETPLDLALQNNYSRIAMVLQEIDELFRSRSERKIVAKLKLLFENPNNQIHVLLTFFNAVNRKGHTLLERALKKGFKNVINIIMKFRLCRKQS